MEIMRDYIIGGDVGIRILAEEPKVQEIIDEHWNDPYNNWPRRLPRRVLDLSQDGELIMPVHLSNGKVFVGQIDPLVVESVDPDAFAIGVA